MEIKKLEDVVTWADNWIKEIEEDLTEEEFEDDKDVKEFEAVKEVVKNAIKRHAVYTSALKNDYANKAAEVEKLEKEMDDLVTERDNLYKGYQKILGENQDLEVKNKNLEKELEGRKECYTALKELVDTKYISIEDHNNSVDLLNKEIERLNIYTANQKKVNHDLVTKVTLLESELADCKVKNRHQRENLDGINKTLEIRTKEKESLINVKNSQEKEIVAHESENKRLSEKIMELKKERDKHMARVNDLRMELDCVKASKEKHEEAAHDKVVEDLRGSIKYWKTKYLATQEERDVLKEEVEELKKKDEDRKDHIKELETEIESWKHDVESWKYNVYEELKKNEELEEKIEKLAQETDYYKNQERIRTDQLRATESKVEELWKEIEKFTKGEDKDHGRAGFETYIRYIISEEEGKFKAELNRKFSEEVSKISQKRTEEELAKAKLNEKFGVGGVPCGEDAIE